MWRSPQTWGPCSACPPLSAMVSQLMIGHPPATHPPLAGRSFSTIRALTCASRPLAHSTCLCWLCMRCLTSSAIVIRPNEPRAMPLPAAKWIAALPLPVHATLPGPPTTPLPPHPHHVHVPQPSPWAGVAAELALTARNMSGAEAESSGLVSRCFSSQEEMMTHVMATARALAAKSPLALSGSKRMLLHARCVCYPPNERTPRGHAGCVLHPRHNTLLPSCPRLPLYRDHSVREGLEHVALWNTGFLLSGDMQELLAAQAAKRRPRYSKL